MSKKGEAAQAPGESSDCPSAPEMEQTQSSPFPVSAEQKTKDGVVEGEPSSLATPPYPSSPSPTFAQEKLEGEVKDKEDEDEDDDSMHAFPTFTSLRKEASDKKFPSESESSESSSFLQSITLCLSSFSKDKREELKSLIRYCGAHFSEAISQQVTYLIAPKVGSIKYRLAKQYSIPVLSPTWLYACWKAQTAVDIRPYLLPPFSGCVISVTGLSAASRAEIQKLVSFYGGEYTANLTKTCTHLISHFPTGLKYRYALEWGVHCVTPSWFFESINQQYCSDETQHFHPLDDTQRQRLFSPLCTAHDLSRLSPALRRKYLLAMKRRRLTGTKRSSSSRLLFYPSPRSPSTDKNAGASPSHATTSTGRRNSTSSAMEVTPSHLSPSLAPDLGKLLDEVEQTIKYYQERGKREDLTRFIESWEANYQEDTGTSILSKRRKLQKDF